jgi:hypothetical protein
VLTTTAGFLFASGVPSVEDGEMGEYIHGTQRLDFDCFCDGDHRARLRGRLEGQGQVTRPGVAPRKWEYTTVAKVGKLNEDTLRPEMALFGVNGWELVTAYNDGGRTILFFKRPL